MFIWVLIILFSFHTWSLKNSKTIPSLLYVVRVSSYVMQIPELHYFKSSVCCHFNSNKLEQVYGL